jgi:phosphoribosylamine--glycine ligase
MVWALAQNPTVDRLFAAPGNAGIATDAHCISVAADDVEGIVELVEHHGIDLTIVGPEGPLVAGVADALEARGQKIFGPSKDAARIEGSKAWAKELFARHGIPSARSRLVTRPQWEDDKNQVLAVLDQTFPSGRTVVKADGLAGGKGVAVAHDRSAAVSALETCFELRAFGEAGDVVLLEEVLEGSEVSAFALCDGRDVMPLALAQDFKRLGEGDVGPNTGGMGAYSPLTWVDPGTEQMIWDDLVRGTVKAMESEGVRYRGLLYAGVMLTESGPKILEFNCRFGDPETEAILPRLRSDFGELVLACVEGNLALYKAHWSEEACVTVVLASEGYPGEHRVGVPIEGIEDADGMEGVAVFHAGTKERDATVVTAGGRVLAVSALGRGVADARARAYAAADLISFDGRRYRTDIAARAAEEERT